MFTNLILYRIHPDSEVDFSVFEQKLGQVPFVPCTPTQERSVGWVPPRGENNGAILEAVGGHWIAKFFVETKAVPPKVLERKVEEKVAVIEQLTGRKPGKKEKRELKDEAKQDLLPMAFAKQSSNFVWIDPSTGLLAINTSSQSRADQITSELVSLLPSFSLTLINVENAPSAVMAQWLIEQEPPYGFSIDRACELKSQDESKAVVRYSRHSLDIEEIKGHIQSGKSPTLLAMTWEDRVSFIITKDLQIKKIEFLDVVPLNDAESSFDSDVAIGTGELSVMIPVILECLGGEAITG